MGRIRCLLHGGEIFGCDSNEAPSNIEEEEEMAVVLVE
jgi:hypothetical protein